MNPSENDIQEIDSSQEQEGNTERLKENDNETEDA